MAVNSQTSMVLSLLLTVGLFAGLQLLKPQLTASPLLTVVTGGVCSLLFLLLVTAVGNLEATLFGKGFQTKLLEVVLCLAMACTAAGMIHRVCITVCFIFSLAVLYYMNQLSQATYGAPVAVQPAPSKKRR
ncbi:protein KRTCAP2 homolog [Amphibalanus amphitrite]|uniref:protein KRTCAP2 homolog n=1 Tax=Amphibalanus amphitrite TaxID=1232801 RepID=UPI001C925E8A|nr:protein KRTCAP2 homolog [Amphibalanus amphitrite]